MDWKYVIDRAQDRHKLNQRQLAVHAGCTQSAISQLYNSKAVDPRYSIGAKLIEMASTEPDVVEADKAGL